VSKPNPTLIQILNDLNLNLSKNPRGTDKGDYKSYISNFYETEFSILRKNKIRLLEIGVRSGASLALWANYFENIEIVGLDISEIGTPIGPVKEYIDYTSIQFYCKDAYSQEVADTFNGKFQILIDDGPHSLTSQIRFLELYLNKLDDNGILIIEDILFGYRDCYQLMKSLPKGNRYLFEIYNFEKIKQDGGFLFVVRHNPERKYFLFKKGYLIMRSIIELLNVLIGRIKRGDFSLKDRRVNH
jgi:predicted O-methyltransferase YrrM